MSKKNIPYGIANYESFVRKNCYFVDKTAYIRALELYENPVFLRPRRFGKSLWCSILRNYYDINKREHFTTLFGHTKIGQDPTTAKNAYMILHLNFSVVDVTDNLDEIEHSFNNECNAALDATLTHNAHRFDTPLAIDPQEKISFNLNRIQRFIVKEGLPPLYVIIDEYDNFSNQLITTHSDALYRKLTTGSSFFRTFFKTLKAGTESGAIAKTFITGVLPITLDDLSSGYNIASFITLDPEFSCMLGYTDAEVDHLLDNVYQDYQLDGSTRSEVNGVIKNHYNGYQFVNGQTNKLYNSSILMYFLRQFVRQRKIPLNLTDPNLKTDIQWVKRLTSYQPNKSKDVIEQLSFMESVTYDFRFLNEKFNMSQFFSDGYYPISFFYLGMLTIKDHFRMCLPNTNMRTIMVEYFNEIHQIDVSTRFTDMMETFVNLPDLNKLFSNYWKLYISQFPADIFQKVNENFYRSTFYELCSRYLSHMFTFYVERSYPSGKSDLEFVGKFHGPHAGLRYLIEFKYYSNEMVKKQHLDIKRFQLLEKDKLQVEAYGRDIVTEEPEIRLSCFLIYCFGNIGFRIFSVDSRYTE